MRKGELLERLELSAQETAGISAAATHRAEFLLCRNRVRLGSNTPVPIESFSRRYGDLFSASARSEADAEMVLYCHDACDNVGRYIIVALGTEAYRIRNPALLQDPLAVLNHLVFSHIETHYLVHAACVSKGGKGIVLSGASGMGKTTLTSFLVSRGMGFLSDELTPIRRTGRWVEPFPMHLGIRPGPAAELVKDLPATEFVFGEDYKRLVDGVYE